MNDGTIRAIVTHLLVSFKEESLTRTSNIIRKAVWAFAVMLPTVSALVASAQVIDWKRIQLDATYRSEGVAAADVNRDGKIDILAGEVWYEAPNWVMHEIRPVGKYFIDNGYSQSFGNFTYDVDRDGWQDYIVIGFPGAPCYWYRNPQNGKGHWPQYEIWHSACNESPNFGDLTGNGIPELIIGSDSQLGFLPLPSGGQTTKKWRFHPLSKPGDPKLNGSHRYYHGLGHGDLNGDGRTDVLIVHGWYEAPLEREAGPWRFHPYVLAKKPGGEPLRAAHIYTYDLDLDGDQDIVLSSAHDYGIWWFENLGAEKHTEFKYHLIDESFSQTHALRLADINGDGHKDLITGKRFFAHNGRDPGGRDAVVLYWIEIKRSSGTPPDFTLHEIVAGRNVGIGTQFLVNDVTGDGLLDIVLSNKKGVNVLVQLRQ